MSLSTPIAFLIFNRPDLTERVFRAIAQARPRRLLVVADGPRGDRLGEAERCAAARAVIGRVDWPCEVQTNYADTNLGCRRRVAGGLDWVFSQVEEAIVLEDDCLPHASFFPFCEQLLQRYRDDRRVMHIGGNNFQEGHRRSADSYFFSKHNHIWGWATWRRAWAHYDLALATWPQLKQAGTASFLFDSPEEERYWTAIFDRMHAGAIDTWDYAWTYACWVQGGLAVYPSVNLVSNIGFRPDATHTTGTSARANLPVGELRALKHPPVVVRHREADEFTNRRVFGIAGSRRQRLAAAIHRTLLDFSRMGRPWRNRAAREVKDSARAA